MTSEGGNNSTSSDGSIIVNVVTGQAAPSMRGGAGGECAREQGAATLYVIKTIARANNKYTITTNRL